jgi:hypothetical protein
MDPTLQLRHRPLKAALDSFVFLIATYLLPACSTLAILFVLYSAGFSALVVALCGTCYYWTVVYEAVTSYRRWIALPRAIDFTLDPPVSQYLGVFLRRLFLPIVFPLIVMAISRSGGPTGLAVGAIPGLCVCLLVRETVLEQIYGLPYLEAGTLGNRIRTAPMVRQLIFRLYGRLSLSMPLGAVELPFGEVEKNVFVVGAVGTGKTLIIKGYLASLLPCVYKYPKWRAVVVDPKGDLAETVSAAVPRHKIQLLNFGSADTLVWDVAKDTGGKATAIQQITHQLIEVQEETQPFFTQAARAILQAVMLALSLQAPGVWRFPDVFFVLRSLKRTEVILSLRQATREVFDTYAANPRVMNDVFATLVARLADFSPIAAIWSHAQHEHPERTFSISDFVRGNSVLLIQMQARASVSQGVLFGLILESLTQELLDQETGQSALDPANSRRTLLTIDEAPRVKSDLLTLITNGRDFGIGTLLSCQSLDAMLQFYSQDKLNALLNEFHTMAFLSANSPTTLKWMAERLGNTDSRLPHSDNPQSHNATGEWTPTLDPTQFHNLRQGVTIGPNCIPGIFLNSQWGAWYSDEGVDLPEIPAQPADRPIPDHWHALRPWDDEDLTRLNLTHLKGELDLDSDEPPPGSTPVPRPRSPRPSPTHIPRFRP